jgi:Holliday junction resolvase
LQEEDTVQRRKRRGKSAELELVHLLERYGFTARRAAASGVGGWVTDVEAYGQNIYVAIECKSSRRDYALIPRHQLAKIKAALHFVSSVPFEKIGLIAVKFPKLFPPWVFYRVAEEDISKKYVRIRRGQASNWIPTVAPAANDPFTTTGFLSERSKMGRPRKETPAVKCPNCGEPAYPPKTCKTVTGGKLYQYYRYYHPSTGKSCKSKVEVMVEEKTASLSSDSNEIASKARFSSN